MYHVNVVEPRRSFMDEISEVFVVPVGGLEMRFKPLFSISVDGWSQLRFWHRYHSWIVHGYKLVMGAGEKGALALALRPSSQAIALKPSLKRAAGDLPKGTKAAAAAAPASASAAAAAGGLVVDDDTSLGVYRSGVELLKVIGASETQVMSVITDGASAAVQTALHFKGGGPRAQDGKREGAVSVVCAQHLHNTSMKNVDKHCAPYRDALTPSLDVAGFLAASSHRFELLRQKMVEAGAKPLQVLRDVPTRYVSKWPVVFRTEKHFPYFIDIPEDSFDSKAVKKANGELGPSARSQFIELKARLAASRGRVQNILSMLRVQMTLSPVLGAEDVYTASLPWFFVFLVMKHVNMFKEKEPEIACEVIRRVYDGLRPIAWVETVGKTIPGGGRPAPNKDSVDWKTQIARDEVTNAAMGLDPAMWSWLDDMGFNNEDARSYIKRVLFASLQTEPLKASAGAGGEEENAASAEDVDADGGGDDDDDDDDDDEDEDDGGGGGGAAASASAAAGRKRKAPSKGPVSVAGKAAPSAPPVAIKVVSNYKSFEAEKAAIEELKKGFAQTPAAFAEKKAALLADAKKRWGIGKKGSALAPRVVLAADEVAWTLINSGVDKEWETLVEHRDKVKAGIIGTYGHPFAPCTLPDESGKDVEYRSSSARYAFWPANKTDMPLLYIAAIILLCNCKATSTYNESFHSVATYILRDSRRSMTNIKAEALALMRSVLPDHLKKIYPELATVEAVAKKDGYLDVAEVKRIMALSADAGSGAGADADTGDERSKLAEAVAAARRVFEDEAEDEDGELIDLLSSSSDSDEDSHE
jgi:hypothetical protein